MEQLPLLLHSLSDKMGHSGIVKERTIAKEVTLQAAAAGI